MIITEKNMMSEYLAYEPVLDLDKKFMDNVKALPLPSEVAGVKIKNLQEIPFQYVIMAWNVNDKNSLFSITCKAYGLKVDDIDSYPMLDFLRLTTEIEKLNEVTAKMFSALKRDEKDAEVKSIKEKFKSNNPTVVLAEIMVASKGAYTQEQVAEMPWKLAYDILEMQTLEFDRQTAVAELQEKRMKDATKRNRR